MGEKNGASKEKSANCTKRPVQPESAMRGEGAMRADKTECAEGRPERCGAVMGDRGGEKGNGSETGRPREMCKRAEINRKRRGKRLRGRRQRVVRVRVRVRRCVETGKGICVSKT